ncbi:hypothetical protein GCM10027294_38420 [Marinactinospora endophytica]
MEPPGLDPANPLRRAPGPRWRLVDTATPGAAGDRAGGSARAGARRAAPKRDRRAAVVPRLAGAPAGRVVRRRTPADRVSTRIRPAGDPGNEARGAPIAIRADARTRAAFGTPVRAVGARRAVP